MTTNDAQQRRAWQILATVAQSNTFDAAATSELIAIGEDAVEALSQALELDHEISQRTASIALAAIPSRRALAPMLNAAGRPSLRPDVVATLLHAAAQRLVPRDRDRVHSFMLRYITHKDPRVRSAAVHALTATADAGAIDEVRELEDDRDEGVRAAVRRYLFRIAHQDEPQRPRAAAMHELQQRLGARIERQRKLARDELQQREDREEFILASLHHDDPYVRRSALEVAASLALPRLAAPLLSVAMEKERSDHERALALRGVKGSAIDASSHRILHELCNDGDLFVRAEAGRLAIRASAPSLQRKALQLLRDDDAWVRKRIAAGWAAAAGRSRARDLPTVVLVLTTAAAMEHPSALDLEAAAALLSGIERTIADGGFIDSQLLDQLSLLRQHTDARLRELARQTLDAIANDTGLLCADDRAQFEVEALYADDPEERMRALEALADEAPEAIVHALPGVIRFLYAATTEELIAACAILHRCTDRRAREALTRLAQHPVDAVRFAATGDPAHLEEDED